MTDPRIEAAARAIGKMLGDEPPAQYVEDARVILAAADAAAPVRVAPMPIPADRMQTAKDTLFCWKHGALTDEEAIGMIVCAAAAPPTPPEPTP